MSHGDLDRVHVYRDEAGEWRWRRTAPNGEVIADSAEGYVDRTFAIHMAHRVNGGDTARMVIDEP